MQKNQVYEIHLRNSIKIKYKSIKIKVNEVNVVFKIRQINKV